MIEGYCFRSSGRPVMRITGRSGRADNATRRSSIPFISDMPMSEIPRDGFPVEVADTFAYFEAHTYLGSDSSDRIALANRIAGRQATTFAAWARANVPIRAA